MIQFYDAETNALLGTLTEAQVRFLANQLEEESEGDQDYYLNAEALDMLEQEGADAPLLALLRQALGDREGMEIRWSRTA